MSSPRHAASSPSPVRFGSLHSKIGSNGGRGAEQNRRRAHDTIGLSGNCHGLLRLGLARIVESVEEAVGDLAAARQHAGELACCLSIRGRYEGTYIAGVTLTSTTPTENIHTSTDRISLQAKTVRSPTFYQIVSWACESPNRQDVFQPPLLVSSPRSMRRQQLRLFSRQQSTTLAGILTSLPCIVMPHRALDGCNLRSSSRHFHHIRASH